MKTFANLLCLLAFTALGTLSASALGKAEDDRVSIGRDKGSPMGAIGMVLRMDADGFEAGTGFLVSPCHIFTAAHVVAGRNGISENQVLLFFAGTGRLGPGDLKSNYFGALSPARPVAWGGYKETESGTPAERVATFRANSWNDWSLLKLDRCLGDDGFGYLKFLPVTTRDFVRGGGKRPVVSVGMPADRDNKKLTMDPDCSLLGQVEAAGWQHDCTTIPGNSGGPVLAAKAEPGEEWPRVLAITVASVGTQESGDGTFTPQLIDPTDPNYLDVLATAVPVAAFLPEIVSYLPPDPRITTYLAHQQTTSENKGGTPAEDRGYDVKNPQLAIEDLTAALTHDPKEPLLLIRRGQWYQAADELPSALSDYSAALAADPNFAPALHSRALLRASRDDRKLGDAKAAKIDLDRLITRFPDVPGLRIERGGLLAGEHDYTAAQQDFDAVLKKTPNNMLALLSRAQARMELGDKKGAGADYDAAIAVEPELAFLYIQRAHYRARMDQMAEAFADIDRALKIEPDMPAAINGRAILYLHNGGADLALADADKAVKLDPESGSTIALRGSIRQILGDLDGAIADYEKAAKLDTKEPFDATLLYLALSEAGRTKDGEAALEKLLARWPAEEWPGPLARHLLGRMSDDELQQRTAEGNKTLKMYQAFDRHFYLGMAAYIARDHNTARDHLAAAVAMGLSQFLEFDIARAYLERLGGPAYLNKVD